MDSTFYFYYGVVEQWLITHGAKEKKYERKTPKKVTFDQLPIGYW